MISWGQLCKPLNVSGLIRNAFFVLTVSKTLHCLFFNHRGALATLVATLPSVIGKKPPKPNKKVKEKKALCLRQSMAHPGEVLP